MKIINKILSFALVTLFTSSLTFAEVEITGQTVFEVASFANSGTSTGDTTEHGKSLFKTQVQAKLFVDGEINDNNTFHFELQGIIDGKAVDDYDDNEQYTQRDFLREAYIDTEAGDWSIRTGKQQVVWGTADGIKLLDLINPTDYSEVNQNTPEDSRIPVWMLNVEKDFDDGGNFQAILSQPRENIFAGLNREIDTSVRTNGTASFRGIPDIIGTGHNQGHAFIFKGVDTITGQKNGFLNIAPDLGSVAAGFGAGFVPLFNQQGANQQGNLNGLNAIAPAQATAEQIAGVNRFNALLTNFTVGGFASGATLAQLDGGFRQAQLDNNLTQDTNADNVVDINDTLGFAGTYFGVGVALQACQNPNYNNATNNLTGSNACGNLFNQFDPAGSGQIVGSQTIVVNATTVIFNQVGTDTFGAETAVTGIDALNGFDARFDGGSGTGYDSNLSSFGDGKRDSAFEYMTGASFRTFDTFVNARSQYIFDMPDNTDADIAFRWKDSASNGLNYSVNYSYNYDANPVIDLSWRNDAGEELIKTISNESSIARNPMTGATFTNTAQYISLQDAAGNNYGGSYGRSAILTFEQTLERAHNIGGSLDYAFDTKALGAVVFRAEGLYQKDVYSPIIDLDLLSIGDLTDALVMTPGDRFKYVLGVDITVLTNMLVSAQFIQDRNLDFVDSGNKYTGDFASMHLTNGLLKAEKNKNFVSLFLSKPFGSSQQHRWNNIIIFEDQGSGGFWNRLDMEYSLTDDAQFTAEWNRYWGEENSQFGQLEKSSNVQLGFKYSF